MPIIKLSGVSHSYKSKFVETKVLKDINLEIEQGKTYSIMGASGSGKSTLLNILGGILIPTTGDVYIDGTNLAKLNEEKRSNFRLNNMGFIFQTFNLIPFLTVEENIFLPLRIQGKSLDVYKESYNFLMKELGIKEKEKSYINELSGGQQQRVAIARCLIGKPKVVFADEPTGSLDSKNSKAFMKLLGEVSKESNATVVVVTHDESVASFTDEIVSIEDGEIKYSQYKKDKGIV